MSSAYRAFNRAYEQMDIGTGPAHGNLAVHALFGRAAAVVPDARFLPLPDGIADSLMMLDNVRYLSPMELHLTVAETVRILRPSLLRASPVYPDRVRPSVGQRATGRSTTIAPARNSTAHDLDR